MTKPTAIVVGVGAERGLGAAVCTENLNPHIMVMKPTKDRV